MKLKMIIASLAIVAISATSVAQTTQRERIKQGVKSGEITKTEAAKIAKERQDILQTKAVAKADGIVTAEEKKIIKKERKQASRTIYRKKHNAKDRK